MTKIRRTNPKNKDFQELVKLLDKDLSLRDGEDHSFYAQFNKIEAIKFAVVIYENNTPIGCGAFKEYDEETAEIKRMFVLPEIHGKGVGRLILDELEKWASEKRFKFTILETGKKQPEAIRLYQKSGYGLIENYGQYKGVVNSVCMKKVIVNRESILLKKLKMDNRSTKVHQNITKCYFLNWSILKRFLSEILVILCGYKFFSTPLIVNREFYFLLFSFFLS